MGLDWINPDDYSLNAFLLLERFQIRLMMESGGWRNDNAEWKRSMGIALSANPAVKWYLAQRCSECAPIVAELTENAPAVTDKEQIRNAEVYALLSVEDFVMYTTPELMDSSCDWIHKWDKSRLFELADFNGKTVLDVGSGSGRLAFAAAEKAAWVYASEPVGTLREYLRDKIKREEIKNMRVVDGLVTELPFPDNTFDIVMSGHVVGDFWDEEIAELIRVCKAGGWLLDCPGYNEDEDCEEQQNEDGGEDELVKRGWEAIGYDRYRKQVIK